MAEPQFEDAFEDAESDYIASKPSITINGTSNSTSTTNGDLPESQSSEGDRNIFIDADESEEDDDVNEEQNKEVDVALANGYLESPSRNESSAGVHEDMTESDSDRDIPEEVIQEEITNDADEEGSDTEDIEDHQEYPEGTEEVVGDRNGLLDRGSINEATNGNECTEDDLPIENRIQHMDESEDESTEEDEECANNVPQQDHIAGVAYKRAVVFPHQDAKCEDERGFSGVIDLQDESESESVEADMDCPEEDSTPGIFMDPVRSHVVTQMQLKEDDEEDLDEEEDQWEDEGNIYLPDNMNYASQQQYHVPSNGHRNDLFFSEKLVQTSNSSSEQVLQPPTPPPSPVPNSSNISHAVDNAKLQMAAGLDAKIEQRVEPQGQIQVPETLDDFSSMILVDVAPLAEHNEKTNKNQIVENDVRHLATSVDLERVKRPLKKKTKTKSPHASPNMQDENEQRNNSSIKTVLDSSKRECIEDSSLSKVKSEYTKPRRTPPGKVITRNSVEAVTRPTSADIRKHAGMKQSTLLSTRMKSEIQFIQDIEKSLAAESFIDADDDSKEEALNAIISRNVSGGYKIEQAHVFPVKKTNTQAVRRDKKSSPKRLAGEFATRPKKDLSYFVHNNSNSNKQSSRIETAAGHPNRPPETRKGDILFDDFAECSEYIKKKTVPADNNVTARKPSWRRRRNSYELANRETSSEDDDSCTTTGSESTALSQEAPKQYNILDIDLNDLNNEPKPPSSIDDNLLEKLAERELAHMKSLHVKSKTPSQFEDASTSNKCDTNEINEENVAKKQVDMKSTPSKQTVKPKTVVSPKASLESPKQPAKQNPMMSPMEYEKIGLRLAGHTNASMLATPEEEGDQFSDAFEDADEDGELEETDTADNQSDKLVEDDDSGENSDDKYHNVEEMEHDYPPPVEDYPVPKLEVDEKALQRAMEELEEAIVSSRQRLRKAPSYAPKSSPWILKPEVAQKIEEDERRKKIAQERLRRKRELELARLRQRVTLPDDYDARDSEETPTVQCYQKDEEDENDEGESRLLISGSDPDHTKPNFTKRQAAQTQGPDTMRAPDLPVTTNKVKQSRGPHDEAALTKGIIYPAAYLGSTQLLTTKTPTKKVRMQQAQEAVGRIKSPDGEEQPSTEVDLSISMDKIRVLNADTQETMMDHPLKTISYIADIGNIVVIMARRRALSKTLGEALEESGVSMDAEGRSQPRKIICHVFETEDAQLIAQTIGQAFSIAYLEFLKQNGIDDPAVYEMDYQDVLNSQEIYGDDLMLFSNKECEKEILVNKERGENMGVVIVESGWGSLIPTVVMANMSPFGAAARCGKLNIGDQIMSINGTSCVGLPLEKCQQLIKSLKSQALVKFNIVSCPPVTQVLVKRPDTRYQLGFSVQNGTICSLMRGGIAERGGVRVGHRIIEINGSSVVAVTHEKIVEMLSNSVGEIRMKTMPLSMYRLLTGQELPVYI